MVTMVLDTGAPGSMISLDLCKLSNLDIYPSSHSTILADGDSQLTVVGEVHYVDYTIHFNNKQGNPKVSLLRTEVSRVVLPGENVMLPVPTNFLMDKELAVELREFDSSCPEPFILKNENGLVSIPNSSNKSVKFKKNQVIGQIRSVVMPPHVPLNNTIKTAAVIKSRPSLTKDYLQQIKFGPDEILSKDDKSLFHDINKKYSSVISPNYRAYNNKSGEILGDVLMGANIPPPGRGKVPSYNSNQSDMLQQKFDELYEKGVLSHPEEKNVSVLHTSPSFLVKKPDGSHRLVTSFVELNKYIRILPFQIEYDRRCFNRIWTLEIHYQDRPEKCVFSDENETPLSKMVRNYFAVQMNVCV